MHQIMIEKALNFDNFGASDFGGGVACVNGCFGCSD
jgi:hypothetical protein